MAWKTVLPMDERVRFVLDVKRDEWAIAVLCRRYEISRKTGYKWIGRYEAEGLEGMRERSRRPLRSPHQTSEVWVQQMIQARLKHPNWGPKKIWELLNEQDGQENLPAVNTIGNVLKRVGLVKPRKGRRRGSMRSPGPLTEPQGPNHVWAVDYKGWFRTQDGERCEPLTVSDLYSRYVLTIKALANQTYESAKKVFEKLFKEYGLPIVIRCDNGGPFGSIGAGGLSRLSVWWMLLGIEPEFIARGHPEQNGVHERMHLTLKQEACRPPSKNRRAQQRRFDRWCNEFNEQRPHEALGMQKPAERYCRSHRHYTGGCKEPSYPAGYQVRRVRSNGQIKWQGRKRFVGEAFKGFPVGIRVSEEARSEVYFGPVLLGALHTMDAGRLQPSVSMPNNRDKRRRKV